MAGEVSIRQWWLVIRREGHVVKRLRVSVNLSREGSDLDRLVDPVPISPDFDLVDNRTGLDDEDLTLVASFEMISTTQSFEINEYE